MAFTTSVKSPEQLIRRIEVAFAGDEYPGDDDIAADSYGDEPGNVRAYFRGQTDWRSLDAQFLNRIAHDSPLAFFSDRAFRFFLPAYLIADIKGELDLDDPTVKLCWSFASAPEEQRIARVWGGGTMWSQAAKCFEPFTAEQVAVIVDYLWWRLESEPEEDLCISESLLSYWLPRSEGSA